MRLAPCKLLYLEGFSIYEQLRLEEALVRAGSGHWCLINLGSPPAIVMGISGKPKELLYEESVNASELPVIRRFSGGGTVVVDSDTIFITFIADRFDTPWIRWPQDLMAWTAPLYEAVLGPDFALRENDYVLGEHKFGGNAQQMSKDRWLHHTSLLWDYQAERMELLKQPLKQPNYRAQRQHHHFIEPLKKRFPSKELFVEQLLRSLSILIDPIPTALKEAQKALELPHRKSLQYIATASVQP